MKYIIEPLLFAFEKHTTEDELIQYLHIIMDFDSWWNDHKDEVYVLSTTGDVLCVNNYYPLVDSLKPLLDKFKINYVSYKDIGRMLDKYLNKAKAIDKICKEEEVIEEISRKIEPPIQSDISKRPKVIHDEFMKLLWFFFYLKLINNDDENSYVLFARGLQEKINIEFVYERLVEKGDNVTVRECEDRASINCKPSLLSFLKDTNTPFLMCKHAESKKDIELGIRTKIVQLNNLSKIEDTYCYMFIIQDSFYEDYCNGYYKNRDSDISSTIQAITEAVMDKNLRKMHAIRKGKSGAEEDLVVNEYAAKRRDITTSIKLAYWKKGNKYRIANMKEHDFFDISEEFE